MTKKLFFILIITFTYNLYSQNLKEIDTFFLKQQNTFENKDYINVFFSSNDCYRCTIESHQLLSNLEKNNSDLNINIITDEIALAKKNFKKYNLKFNYFIDKKVFLRKDVKSKSFIYLKINNSFYESNEITDAISNQNKLIEKIVIKDSLLINNKFYTSKIDNQNILLFDYSMDLGLFINLNNLKNNFYKEVNLESKKIYNLPFEIDTTFFKLIDYKTFSIAKEQFQLPEIKIHSINISDGIAVCNFSVSRLFEEVQKKDKHGLITYNYVAIKNLNNQISIEDILDIESYDSYFDAEKFPYENNIYRAGLSIYSQTKIIDNKTIRLKVEEIENNKSIYKGEATFKINNHTLTLTEIDFSIENNDKTKGTIQLNNQNFRVIKKDIDENTNIGSLHFVLEQ